VDKNTILSTLARAMSKGNEMLKMLESFETEIYISEPGYLAIKQKNFGEECLILLSREQTLILKDNLTELLAEQDEVWDGLQNKGQK
jgi:hypothetical protein